MSFFLGSWGMNRSAGQTNRVNREAVLGRFVCSALRFIPHEPRKKDTHSLNTSVKYTAMLFVLYSVVYSVIETIGFTKITVRSSILICSINIIVCSAEMYFNPNRRIHKAATF